MTCHLAHCCLSHRSSSKACSDLELCPLKRRLRLPAYNTAGNLLKHVRLPDCPCDLHETYLTPGGGKAALSTGSSTGMIAEAVEALSGRLQPWRVLQSNANLCFTPLMYKSSTLGGCLRTKQRYQAIQGTLP